MFFSLLFFRLYIIKPVSFLSSVCCMQLTLYLIFNPLMQGGNFLNIACHYRIDFLFSTLSRVSNYFLSVALNLRISDTTNLQTKYYFEVKHYYFRMQEIDLLKCNTTNIFLLSHETCIFFLHTMKPGFSSFLYCIP